MKALKRKKAWHSDQLAKIQKYSFKKNDLVLAKIRGYSAWPAQVGLNENFLIR